MTHGAAWAVEQVRAEWIRREFCRVSPPAAIGFARHWLVGLRRTDVDGWVHGTPDGLSYSAPDGEVGELSWDQVVEVVRESEAQKGLF